MSSILKGRRFGALAAVLAATALVPLGSAGADLPQPVYQEGLTFGAPVRMNYTDPAQLGGPAEPSIKVDSAGTIYVAGVCCIVRAAPAWYSRDGGASWKNLPSPAGARETGVGAEGDFAVDDADSLYFSDTWIPSIFLTKWSGHGDTWEYTNDTVTVLPGFDDRPWLAYAHGTLFMYVNHLTHVQVWKSTDGGHTWGNSFTTFGQGQRYFPGMISTDRRTGSAYLFGSCQGGWGGNQLCSASSHDGGATWTETNPAVTIPSGGLAQFMVATDVDAAGNVYATYAASHNSGCDVYLAVSSDRGATWKQFKVNPADGCSTFPWVAAGSDGRAALAWYYNTSKRGQDSVTAGSEWKLQTAVVTGATSDTPVVTHGTLAQVVHRGALGRNLWDYLQIAVGPDGRFHVAFAEDAAGPCAGPGAGSIAGYTKKCTDWVAQTGGPRAAAHAADATSVDSLAASAGAGTVQVSGSATFGRAQPVTVFSNNTISAPGFDLVSGSIVRPSALSDELVFELKVNGLPEAATSTGQSFTWPVKVDGRDYDIRMTPRPWRFEICPWPSGQCTRIRGDTDAGGDRVVARVPLAAVGAANGGTVAKGHWFVASSVSTIEPDRGDMGTNTYPIPVARATVEVSDASGAEVVSAPASLSGDLSSFTASLDGLEPGTYTVSVEACFASNCATASQAEVLVG